MLDLSAPFLTEEEQQEELQDLEATWPLARIIQAQMQQMRTCVVLGSYKGKVMQWLMHQHSVLPSQVIGYEPQRWANIVARERLSQYDQERWRINDYGLWLQDTELPMYCYGTDACSIVPNQPARIESTGEFKAIEPVLRRYIEPIDLMIMNIEGAEYALLNTLLADGQPNVPSINHLAVQFHESATNLGDLHHALYRLDETYKSSYTYALTSWGYWWN